MVTALDRRLAELVKPLVGLDMQLLAAPHVNTLCLAYHYRLAHGRRPIPMDRIRPEDWNRDWRSPELLQDLISSHIMFYNDRNVADQLKAVRVDRAGYFYSMPVTRFRQRQLFLRKSAANLAAVERLAGQPLLDVLIGLVSPSETRRKSYIVTDIVRQAEAVARAIAATTVPRYLYPDMLLGDATQRDNDAALMVFSAPASEYMRFRGDRFISLDIDGLPIQGDGAYETHIIWHLPPGSPPGANSIIRKSLFAYHGALFDAAGKAEDGNGFGSVAKAITQVLSTKHPSFGAEILRDAREFRDCLWRYHGDPAAELVPN